jgi:hypothetical protein
MQRKRPLVDELRELEDYLEEHCPVASLLREISQVIFDLEVGGTPYSQLDDGTIVRPR